MIKLAAGTVEGVYPRPVCADSWESVADFVKNELNAHSDKFGLSVSMFLANKFDRDGNYVAASIAGTDENEFRTTQGTLSEALIREGYRMIATERYSGFPLFSFEAKTLEEMAEALKNAKVSGTVIVTFKCYPYGYRGISEEIKQFSIVV